MRVAALKRLWECADPSPGRRLFRHAFYARIALLEPAAWKTCGTPADREKAIKDPAQLRQGSRPSQVIVDAWNAALAAAFVGLEFEHIRGSKDPRGPAGYWTMELKTID